MCGVSYILSRESLRSCKTRFDAFLQRGAREQGVPPAENAWEIVHVASIKRTTDLLRFRLSRFFDW